MATVPIPPAEPTEPRTSVWVWILGVGAALLLAVCVWLGYKAFSNSATGSPSSLPPGKAISADPPNPPPFTIAPPATTGTSNPPPVGRPTYSAEQVDILKEQARQEERQRLILEQQYGGK